ncbi:MAG: 4Fe-4S dicluster domain-containing protein [Deltaproteobacteria bacterium]|nr:4Fe-4S dicluster domain-containing protein [Deltaproteobacteria bacterium]
MGHLGNGQGVYGRLRKRLDRYPIGAPPAPALYEILKRLFSEKEAFVASKMPLRFVDLAGIARRTKIREAELLPLLETMAGKGLVMDFTRDGQTLYILSPTLLGFFEFAFMRVRDDIPQKELAHDMVEYVHEAPEFVRSIFAGKVQPGRALVHESAIDPEDAPRVFDYERAAHLIGEARMCAVSLCYCRHVMEHEGKSCSRPLEVCTTFNGGADFLTRRGLARRISKEEALEIFAATREAGLVHIADNVKKRPTFICHCCGCCCGLLTAINRFKLFGAVVTSPFSAAVDTAKCIGCGLCAKRCPIAAIAVEGTEREAKASIDERACLGCGVCRPACAKGALRMAPRKERVLVPEDAWHKTVLMAIERGKFADLLFGEDRLDHAVLRAITRIVVSLPPVKKALLAKQVDSRYLQALVG